MSRLLLHPRTQLRLEAFIKNPSHAVILSGPGGAGKGAVAKKLAEDLLGIKDLASYPYARLIASKEGKAISIDEVRGLDDFLSLRVPGKKLINRIVVIEDADLLTKEAQNALLKTLEEPPQGTVLILTASYTEGLLSTIRSRAQSITIQIPPRDLVVEYFQSEYSESQVKQIMAITGGLPGLMYAMLAQNGSHPLEEAVNNAKQYVQGAPYERLIQNDKLAKDRKLTEETLYIVQQMAHISLQSAAGKSAKRWQSILEASYDASEALNQNGQVKLVLANLALSF